MARSLKDLPDKPSTSVDGFPRSKKAEEELNDLAVSVFGRGNGSRFLDYMKSITTPAMGAQATEAELRHLSGQRWLVYIIESRMRAGRKARKDELS